MKKHLLIASVSIFATISAFGQQVYDTYEANPNSTTFGATSKFRIINDSQGAIDLNATNPSAVGNTSSKVAHWSRPAGGGYPATKFALRNRMTDAASYASNAVGTPKITMWIYTNAPIGTIVDLTLGDSTSTTVYPADSYTMFSKATTVTNAWELMSFDWNATGIYNGASVPFGGTASTAVTKIVLQIDRASSVAWEMYFDEITGPGLTAGTKDASSLVSTSKLYPNPAFTSATVELELKSAANVKVVLNDMLGQEVKVITEKYSNSLSESFDVTGLKGIYTISYMIDGVPAKTEKLVVK